MIKKLIKKFDNASLYSKISIIIWVLVFMISGIIILTSIFYYSYMSKKKMLANIKISTQNAANTININYTNILEGFVAACGTEEFTYDLEIISDPQVAHLAKEALVQKELSALSNCNYMVNSALILSSDGTSYYSLYKDSLRSELINPQELDNISGVTWLSERKSPFRNTINVIPIVFPVSIINSIYTGISNNETESPDAYVIIMLDSGQIAKSLAISSESGSDSTFLFMTPEGIPLNPSGDNSVHAIMENTENIQLFQNFVTSFERTALFTDSGYYLIASKLSNCDLILVNCFERESFVNTFGLTGLIILIVLIVVVVILLAFSFLTAHYITRPLNTLVTVVNKISNNDYNQHITFSTNDEMGELCRAINSMHNTIQDQMEHIKKEEAEKYMAEIKLLAEQINPHFLYNTLECIRLEVISGNSSIASNMIQYLAEYLRIGLSYGDDLITISSELRHVNAYIRIMNQRFRQSIIFMYKADLEISRQYILKAILQPLVENSIKHGFSIDSNGVPISSPSIEINFYIKNQLLHIEVVDNGAGFDVENTKEILYHGSNNENDRHLGLHNIYYRLITYYGKDNVFFELNSIPFYSNSILIKIPLQKGIS